MQNVVDVQQREAQRQADIAGTQRNAQAVGAGAFGGSRQAITDAEAQRNLAFQKGDIQAQGLHQAYGQAANQFNQDYGRNLQAQQLGEQSRQYGAGLGMQGLQTGLQAAGQLGQLGQTQYGQQMGINQLQNQYGAQQQQQTQRGLDTAYQDFQNQQNYPYKQLGFMSDLIRGLPLGQKSTSAVYDSGPGLAQTIGSLGIGAAGLSKAGLFADGGAVKTYAGDKGSVTSQRNKDSIVEGMYSMEGLQKAKEAALNRRDMDTVQAIDERLQELNAMKAQTASLDYGLGSAFDQIPQERQEEMMAGGGMVAFGDGGDTYRKQFKGSMDTLTGMAEQQPKAQTPEELEEGAMKRLPILQRMMGEDATKPYAEELKAKRAALPEQMEKDTGLAMAMAGFKMLGAKGNTQKAKLIQGISDAGESFTSEVGRLKKENREADDKLRQSELLIATAQQQRKEGMVTKALASEEKADDKRQDAYKTKMAIQEKATQLLGSQAQTEMQGENALKVAGVTAASHLAAAKINKEAGATADRQIAALAADIKEKNPNMSPAEINARATKEFLNLSGRYPGNVKEDLARDTLTLKQQEKAEAAWNAAMMTPKDPAFIQMRNLKKSDPSGAAAEEYKARWIQERMNKSDAQQQAPGAAQSAPVNTAMPSRSGPQPASTAIPPQAVDILKKNPSPENIKYFDQTFGQGAAARALGR
jgi:hypothetical protein